MVAPHCAGATRLDFATTSGGRKRVVTKLGLRDRIQAVVPAYEAGIVTPGGGPPATPRR